MTRAQAQDLVKSHVCQLMLTWRNPKKQQNPSFLDTKVTRRTTLSWNFPPLAEHLEPLAALQLMPAEPLELWQLFN